MSMVQLSLDEKDKESFTEMQQSLAQAQQELSALKSKLRIREQEQRTAGLTLAELQGMDDSTAAYQQVGKMFLQRPLPDLKRQLAEKTEACAREREALTGKKGHVEAALKKLNDDFQEFIRAHLMPQETGSSS